MKKLYRVKQGVTAEQWLDEAKPLDDMEYLADENTENALSSTQKPIYTVETVSGVKQILLTNWIVWYIHGGKNVLTDTVFKSLYELADEDEA